MKVICACQHEVNINDNADQFMIDMAKNNLCPKCATADAVASAEGLPKLKGTPKQVAWACDIREKVHEQFREFRAEYGRKKFELTNLGTEIKIRRIKKRIAQKELAEVLGISQTHLSNVEHGRTMLGLEGLLKVKRYLACTLDDLLDPEMSSATKETGKKVKRYKLVPYEE